MIKDLVSIVIPTFNDEKYLKDSLDDMINQTYKNIEIIVVNNCSTEKEYYRYNWKDQGINIIHLDKPTSEIFGYTCVAHVRNTGIEKSSGKYIAFCDDDDIWFPYKLELQINAMKRSGCKMSCTDGLWGEGEYDKNGRYSIYNAVFFYNILKDKYKNTNFLDNGFPEIWDLEFLKIHNCVICSSVIMEKSILDIIGNMKCIKSCEDYDCWLRALNHTNIIYLKDICFYYDGGHGYGQNYEY